MFQVFFPPEFNTKSMTIAVLHKSSGVHLLCAACGASAPVCLPAAVRAPAVPLWPLTSEIEAAPTPACKQTHTNTLSRFALHCGVTAPSHFCLLLWVTCQQGSGDCRPEPAVGWLPAPDPSSDCGTSSGSASSAETLPKSKTRDGRTVNHTFTDSDNGLLQRFLVGRTSTEN